MNIRGSVIGNVLDIGCGTGNILKILGGLYSLNLFGVDISKKAIEYCKIRNLKNVYLANAENLPFESNQFDLILALDVIEHLQNPFKTISELYRVGRNGCFIIITVPSFQKLYSTHDISLGHIKRYNKVDLLQLINSVPIIIEKLSYYNFFLFIPIALIRLIRKIQLSNSQRDYQSDLSECSSLINTFLKNILFFESKILEKTTFPFGLSLIVVFQLIK